MSQSLSKTGREVSMATCVQELSMHAIINLLNNWFENMPTFNLIIMSHQNTPFCSPKTIKGHRNLCYHHPWGILLLKSIQLNKMLQVNPRFRVNWHFHNIPCACTFILSSFKATRTSSAAPHNISRGWDEMQSKKVFINEYVLWTKVKQGVNGYERPKIILSTVGFR